MDSNKFFKVSLFLCLTSILWPKIKVVSTFSDFAFITEEIGGDLVEVEYLSRGDQDPHFVAPKPSLALKVKKAEHADHFRYGS